MTKMHFLVILVIPKYASTCLQLLDKIYSSLISNHKLLFENKYKLKKVPATKIKTFNLCLLNLTPSPTSQLELKALESKGNLNIQLLPIFKLGIRDPYLSSTAK